MEYNRSKLPNWKHCQRCGRLYKGLWEPLCADCRAGRFGQNEKKTVEMEQEPEDTLKEAW